MSLLLFTDVVDIFSEMVKRVKHANLLRGVGEVRDGAKISILQYVDDSLMFGAN